MFTNLMRIIILFFFIYLIFRIIRSLFIANRKIRDNIRKRDHLERGEYKNGKIINLDKDQYKVE